MKRLHFIMALALIMFMTTAAQAEEKYVGGGFEASGSIVTGAGYQKQTTTVVDAGTADDDAFVSGFGVLGNYYGALPTTKQGNWRFFVDSVELDLMKSFGENIRFRADLDFGRAASGSNSGAFALEQAYATANIPAGNGIEFLLGRFNAPIGFDSVDVADSTLISQTFLVRSGVRPTNVTGGKFYYAFNDSVDFHFYLANQFTGDTATINAGKGYPGIGLRLGYNWGDEGTESTFGFSTFASAENTASDKYSYAGDVDFNWWVNESFAFGGEVLFRRDPTATTGPKQETLSGLLNLNYAFSDVWDGTFRYNYTKQYDSAQGTRSAGAVAVPVALTEDFLGFEGSAHEASLGVGYAVADGAWLRIESRFDWLKAGGAKGYDYGGALAFAYNF